MNDVDTKRQDLLDALFVATNESQVVAAIVDLHSTQANGYASNGSCEGCDGDGDVPAEWPCRTIKLIADQYAPAPTN